MQKSVVGPKSNDPRNTVKPVYKYDDEVEKQLKELLGKLGGASAHDSTGNSKELNYLNKKILPTRIKKTKEKLHLLKEEPTKVLSKSPKPKISYASPYSKVNLGVRDPENTPPEMKIIMPAIDKPSSVFLKKPQSELLAALPLYKIKWFAPDSNFKGKPTELKVSTTLGKGAFATVYEAIDSKLDLVVAVKIFDKRMLKDASKRKEVQNELDLISKLDHPNIVKLLRTVEDSNQLYVVMENWGKHTLESLIKHKKLQASDLFGIFEQLVGAVEYLHEHNVFHRDIKLSNIMLRDGTVCLLDFGLASNSNYTREFLFCGTPVYMAPEMNNRKGYEGAPVDVWCIGVCIFKALTDHFPFGGIFII